MRLEGKTALVTGGSQGIGEAIAKRLAAEGASVAVVASSSRDNAEAVRALVGAVEKRFGGIDTLVNSAGVFYPTPAGSTPKTDAERIVEINLMGVWSAIDAATPGMKQRKGGQIINI